MTLDEIKTTVNGFLVEEFEVEESKIIADANLRDTLELDSLDYVDLVVVIESHFGFKVVSEDFLGIHTFNDFYTYCFNKVQSKENITV